MSFKNEIIAGAVGGLAGGLAMSLIMVAGKKSGVDPTPPPERVEHWAEHELGVADETTARQEKMIAQAIHFGTAALYGAAYGAFRALTRSKSLAAGPLFGMGVYALNLGIIGPALDITRPPWEQESMRAGERMIMHTLYGVITGFVGRQIYALLERDSD
jgi:hypothetical protein